MAFDVDGARKSGYSDAEIAQYLSGEHKFDYQGATSSGYTPSEIISHLSGDTTTAAKPSMYQNVYDALTMEAGRPEPADVAPAKPIIPTISTLTTELRAKSRSLTNQEQKYLTTQKNIELAQKYPKNYYTGVSGQMESFGKGLLPTSKESPPDIEQAYPITHAAGQLAGLAGTALLTRGIAPAVTTAKMISTLPTIARMAAGKMAQTGATFGIKEFMDNMAEMYAGKDKSAGEVFKNTLMSTASGAGLGLAGTPASPFMRIPAEMGYGYLDAKIRGADNFHAGLNAGLFGLFGLLNTKNLSNAYKMEAYNGSKRALVDRLMEKGADDIQANRIANRYFQYAINKTGGWKNSTIKDFDTFSKAMKKGWDIAREDVSDTGFKGGVPPTEPPAPPPTLLTSEPPPPPIWPVQPTTTEPPPKYKAETTNKPIWDNQGKKWVKPKKGVIPSAEPAPPPAPGEDVLAAESGLKTPVSKPVPSSIQEYEGDAGKEAKQPVEMTLGEFEEAGNEPYQITQQQWVNIQRNHRKTLGQPEKSGTSYAPFSDYEQYHKQSVKQALSSGKTVSPEVLKDYPELQPVTPSFTDVLNKMQEKKTFEHEKLQPQDKINSITLEQATKKLDDIAHDENPQHAKGLVDELNHHLEEGVQKLGKATIQDAIASAEGKVMMDAAKGEERKKVMQKLGEVEPEIKNVLNGKPVEPVKMTREESFKKALEGKANKALDVPIRHNGKIKTKRQMVDDVINYGGHPEIKEVVDMKAKDNASELIRYIRSQGDQNIRAKDIAEAMKIIENPPIIKKYRLVNNDGSFLDISKTEYDYAATKAIATGKALKDEVPKPPVSKTTPKTGQPFEFSYSRNKEKAPYLGSRFGQDIEPHGQYVIESNDPYLKNMFPDKYEMGIKKFNNPLVIDAENWKQTLSDKYKAKKMNLSIKLRKEGYDGIVTIGKNGETGEIVDLSMIPQSKLPTAKALKPPVPKPIIQKSVSKVEKIKIVKDVMKFTPSQKQTLEQAIKDISSGELVNNQGLKDPEGYYTGEKLVGASMYPEYFKNKGYTAKEVLNAIKKSLNGQPVTKNQQIIVEDINQGIREQWAGALKEQRATKEVTAWDLQEGDKLKRHGETYTVKSVDDTEFEPKVTIKNSETLTLKGDETIKYDRGTLRKGEVAQEVPQPPQPKAILENNHELSDRELKALIDINDTKAQSKLYRHGEKGLEGIYGKDVIESLHKKELILFQADHNKFSAVSKKGRDIADVESKYSRAKIANVSKIAPLEFIDNPAFVSFKALNTPSAMAAIKKLKERGYDAKRVEGNYIKIMKSEVATTPAQKAVVEGKTVDEFIKANNEIVYHGTNYNNARAIQKEGLNPETATSLKEGGKGIFLTGDEQYAKSYATQKGGSNNFVLAIRKPLDTTIEQSTFKKGMKFPDLISGQKVAPEDIFIKGKDGQWYPIKEFNFFTGEPTTFIGKTPIRNLKEATKSQLTKAFNEAKGTVTPDFVKTDIKGEEQAIWRGKGFNAEMPTSKIKTEAIDESKLPLFAGEQKPETETQEGLFGVKEQSAGYGKPRSIEEFRNWVFKHPEGGSSLTPKKVFDWREQGEELETLADIATYKDDFRFKESLGKGSSDWKSMLHLIPNIKAGKEMTIYRAVEKGEDEIIPGAYVSESLQYAKDHGERTLRSDYEIKSLRVYPDELMTYDDPHEFIYIPRTVGIGYERYLRQAKNAGVVKEQAAGYGSPLTVNEITAYHGSPYRFDKFSSEKIGTGEGAQAFGHGLYFTDEKEVAEWYAKRLTEYDRKEAVIAKAIFDRIAKGKVKISIKGEEYFDDEFVYAFQNKIIKLDDLPKTESEYFKQHEPNSSTYSVTLHKGKSPEQYEYLRWDLPVSRQIPLSSKIRKSFQDRRFDDWQINSMIDRDVTGEQIYTYLASSATPKGASELLLKNGIDGIKYPSGSLSGKESDKFNYVVFDPKAVTIESVGEKRTAYNRRPDYSDILSDMMQYKNVNDFIYNKAFEIRNRLQKETGYRADKMMTLYHGTDVKTAKQIRDSGTIGVSPNSITFFTKSAKEAAEYSRNKAKYRNDNPVVLKIEIPSQVVRKSQQSSFGGYEYEVDGILNYENGITKHTNENLIRTFGYEKSITDNISDIWKQTGNRIPDNRRPDHKTDISNKLLKMQGESARPETMAYITRDGKGIAQSSGGQHAILIGKIGYKGKDAIASYLKHTGDVRVIAKEKSDEVNISFYSELSPAQLDKIREISKGKTLYFDDYSSGKLKYGEGFNEILGNRISEDRRPDYDQQTYNKARTRLDKISGESGGVGDRGRDNIAGEMLKNNRVDLRGQRANTRERIAVISQVFRSTEFETFRIGYIKDGVIVGHEGVSSRMPGISAVFVPGEDINKQIYKILNRANRLGADEIFFLHNHPTGNPTPSFEDRTVTRKMNVTLKGFAIKHKMKVPKFIGHIVIDTSKYSVISESGDDDIYDLPAEHVSEEPHKYGDKISGPEDIVRIGQQLKHSENFVTIIYRGSDGKINAVEAMPIKQFLATTMMRDKNGSTKIQDVSGILRNRARAYGAFDVFTYHDGIQEKEYRNKSWGLRRTGVLRDAYYGSWQVGATSISHPANQWMGVKTDKTTVRVAEGTGKKYDFETSIKWPADIGGYVPPKFNIEKSVLETAKTVDEFVDESFNIGLSIKQVKLSAPIPDAKSGSPIVEARWQKAKGIQRPSTNNKIRESLLNLYHSFKRSHIDLDPKLFPVESEILRQYKTIPEYSKLSAEQVLKGITAGLNKQQYDIFSRNIILADLVKDVQSGKIKEDAIPFGYKNIDEITQDISKFQDIVDNSPEITTAINVRKAFMDTLRSELVTHNLLPQEVLSDPNYFHRQILAYMELNRPYTGTSSKDVRLHKKGFQMARRGSSLDYNTEYLESEFEVISQAISQLETIETLQKIKDIADIRDSLIKQHKDNWKSHIPDGYSIWQPKKGNHFYLANSITDKVLDDVFSGMKELDPEDIKSALAVGRKRLEWVIPEPLAKTLDDFRDFKDQGFIERLARSSMASWKQWTLLNPMRVVKYNINNLSGDFDIAFAYKPQILWESYRAAKDLKSYHMGKGITQDLMQAVKKGVIDSGLSVEEIPDIKDIGIFKKLTSGGDPNWIDRYWKTVKGFTAWRENILRLSAYRYFRKELAKGKKLYGVSNTAEIDKITDLDDKAAKLARELIGDYGNISKSGQWIRERMMPFYSWTEINAPRYVRLFKNAPIEGEGGYGKIGVLVGLKIGGKLMKTTIMASALYALINVYNRVMFPDEEEELQKQQRRQLHLILGRNEDGTISTIRVQGALSDALSWFGLEDVPNDIKQLREGKISWQDKLIEMVEAPAQKIVQASRPVERALIESLTGKTLYPDITKPKPIRDTAEHIARTLSVDVPYRHIAGKPTKGIGQDIKSMATYTSDPGEITYFNTKKIVSDFLRKHNVVNPSIEPTNKSNALYYYKLAIKYKDKTAQEKYLRKYKELGGTDKGMNRSIEMAHPLSGVPKRMIAEFNAGLSAKDKESIKNAEKWYKETYLR